MADCVEVVVEHGDVDVVGGEDLKGFVGAVFGREMNGDFTLNESELFQICGLVFFDLVKSVYLVCNLC